MKVMADDGPRRSWPRRSSWTSLIVFLFFLQIFSSQQEG
jgi:hypothetical protein